MSELTSILDNINQIYNRKNNINNLIQILQKNEINIIFACTFMADESTLGKYFDKINNEINKLTGNLLGTSDIIKNTYFVMTGMTINDNENSKLQTLLLNNKYNVMKDNNKNTFDYNLIDFIRKNTIKFDIIIFAGCNDLIDIIGKNAGKLSIEEYKQNLIILFNSLNDDGFIINFYYLASDMLDVTDLNLSLSFASYGYFHIHIALNRCFTKLFSSPKSGIYKKDKKIFGDKINKIIDDSFNEIDEELKQITKDNTNYETIVKIILDKYQISSTLVSDDIKQSHIIISLRRNKYIK